MPRRNRELISHLRTLERRKAGRQRQAGGLPGQRFEPQQKRLQDGLPADAWTNVDQSRGGRTTLPGQRPFTQDEMNSILGAEISAD